VVLLGRFESVPVVVVSMLALAVATLTTNLAANVVAPANAITNLAPRSISFRTGGMVTGIIGILMMPWKLLADPEGYIFTWLIGYSALLGPIAGILICDYWVVRRLELNLGDLYRPGEYVYHKGFHIRAMVALILGIIPNVPGFLGTIGVARVAPFWMSLYTYAWFVGFGVSFIIYLGLMKRTGKTRGG